MSSFSRTGASLKWQPPKPNAKLFFNLRPGQETPGLAEQQRKVAAVAQDLGVPPATVVEMESRLSGQDVGYDGPSAGDEDDSPYLAPVSFLQSHREDPETAAVNDDIESQQLDLLAAGLGELDDRSRDIIQRRWLDEPKATLQTLGDEYGVSAERIRQLGIRCDEEDSQRDGAGCLIIGSWCEPIIWANKTGASAPVFLPRTWHLPQTQFIATART